MSSITDTPVEFLPTGAIIKSFTVGGVDIVLGFPTEALYKSTGNKPFFGETIGRVANRISGAEIKSLNGKSYKLEANEAGRTNLHGGSKGWGKQTWEGPKPVNKNGREEVMFKHHSPDGDAGFPGAVEARVYYSVEKVKNDGVQLDWEYEVELVGDEVDETVVNMTNHGFWNLSGDSTIEGTELTLSTADHLPIDGHGIPTKEIKSFPGITAKKSVTLGAKEMFIDHCFVLNSKPESVKVDTRSAGLQHALHMYHPKTGIHLDVETTEPAFQVYTGEGINVAEINEDGHKVPARGARSGVAIEPSRYVNAINTEEWKHQVVLKKGEVWGSKSRFTAYKE